MALFLCNEQKGNKLLSGFEPFEFKKTSKFKGFAKACRLLTLRKGWRKC
jgi:hypothetical protein